MDATQLPLGRVANTLALVLCFGGAFNVVTDYEWLPFRAIDLYSWAPASKDAYRAYWNAPSFVLPADFAVTDTIELDDMPGVIVYDTSDNNNRDHHKLNMTAPVSELTPPEMELRQSILKSKHYSPISDTILLKVEYVYVAVETIEAPISWSEFLFDPNTPRVIVRCFSSYQSMAGELKNRVTGTPYRGRKYSTSFMYWILMLVPVLLLGTDLRLPIAKEPARSALFKPFPKTVLLLKLWFWDNAILIYAVGQAKTLGAPGLEPLSKALLGASVVSSAIATLYTRNISLNGNPIATTFWILNQVYKCWALAMISIAVRNFEIGKNLFFPSMYSALCAQSLAVTILGDFVVRFTPRSSPGAEGQLSRAHIETGLIKFVVSVFFYSASATKLGACGLKWIDDRYLVQLALRGRLGRSGPFPLESLVLNVPSVVRSLGMLIVLLMELTALYSWYSFGHHVLQWFLFMTGSTISIGIPIRPDAFGPLEPLIASTVAPLLKSRLGIILVVLGLVVGLLYTSIPLRKATSRNKSA